MRTAAARTLSPLVVLLAVAVLTGALTTAGRDSAGASWNKKDQAGASWNKKHDVAGASWNKVTGR